MRMRRLTVFVFIVIASFAYGQNGIRKYQPFAFENYTPKWKHVVIDSSIIGDTLWNETGYQYIYDGLTHMSSILPGKYLTETKNNIYHFLNNEKRALEGGYLECLDKTTGEKKWTNSFDLRSNFNNEYPYSISLDNNGDVEILGFRRLDRDSLENIPWFQSTIFKRKYNSASGEVISYSYGKESDTLNQIIRNPLSLNTNTITSYLFHRKHNPQYLDVISYVNVNTLNYYSKYNSKILNDIGHKVNESKYETLFTYLPMFNKVVEVQGDLLLLVRYSAVNNYINRKDSFNIMLELVDRELNIKKSKNLTELVYPSHIFRFVYADDQSFIILGKEYSDSESEDYIINRYHLFDMEGNLQEVISIKNNYKFGIFDFPSISALKLKNKNEMVFFAKGNRAFEDGYRSLNIYKSDGKGNLDTLKILKVMPKNHSINPVRIHQLQNSDLILECMDENPDLDLPFSDFKAQVLICFDAKKLGINTSTAHDTPINSVNVSISPNPSKNIIEMSFGKEFSGNVEFYNEVGKLVFKSKIIQQSEYNINISALTKGIYFIKTICDVCEIKYNTVKFVKE